MLAIIGGTVLPRVSAFKLVGHERIVTDYGDRVTEVLLFEWSGSRVAFLARHGLEQTVPPHRINYRANIDTLHRLGASRIVAVSAVGGIDPLLIPGAIAVPDQIIDYTWGRVGTFFEDNLAAPVHVDFSHPFDEGLRQSLLNSLQAVNAKQERPPALLAGGVYGCTQGPRLETAAEIERMSRDGCALVGMTGMPEAALARELDLPYAILAVSVNRAAGLSEETVSTQQIRAVAAESSGYLSAVLQEMLVAGSDRSKSG